MLLFILAMLCPVMWTQRIVPCDYDPPGDNDNICSAMYENKECGKDHLYDTRFNTPTTFKIVPFDKMDTTENKLMPGGRISVQYFSDFRPKLFMISVNYMENFGCLFINATLYNTNAQKIVTVDIEMWPLERNKTYNFTGVWNSSTSTSSVFVMTTPNVPKAPKGWSMTLSYSLRSGTLPLYFTRPPKTLELRTFKIFLCRELLNSRYRCTRDRIKRTAFVFPDVTESGIYRLTVKPRWNQCSVCYSVSTETFVINQGKIVNIFNHSEHSGQCFDGQGECVNATDIEEGKHDDGYEGTIFSTSDTYIEKPKGGPRKEIRKIKRKLRRKFRNNSKQKDDAPNAETSNTTLDTEALLYSAIFVGSGCVFGALIFFICTYKCKNASKGSKSRHSTADYKNSQKDEQIQDILNASGNLSGAKPLMGSEIVKRTSVFILYADDVFQHRDVIHAFIQFLTSQWQCDVICPVTEDNDVDNTYIRKSMEEASYVMIVNSERAFNYFQIWGNPRYSGEDRLLSTSDFVRGLNVIAKMSVGNPTFCDKLILIQFPYTQSKHVIEDFFAVKNYQIPRDLQELLHRIGVVDHAIANGTKLLQSSEEGTRFSIYIKNMVSKNVDLDNSPVYNNNKTTASTNKREGELQFGRFVIDPDDCSLFHNPSITPAVTLMEVDIDSTPYENRQDGENCFSAHLSSPRYDIERPEHSNVSNEVKTKCSSRSLYKVDRLNSSNVNGQGDGNCLSSSGKNIAIRPNMGNAYQHSVVNVLPKFHPPSEDFSLSEDQQHTLMQNINERYLEDISKPKRTPT